MDDHSIDITGEVCPMTFVKVKLKLETLPPGARLSIHLNRGEPLENVPRSLREEGYPVGEAVAHGDHFVIQVIKGG